MNPGSTQAREHGCICAVLDNNHGTIPVFYDDEGVPQWWITQGCPLHAPRSKS